MIYKYIHTNSEVRSNKYIYSQVDKKKMDEKLTKKNGSRSHTHRGPSGYLVCGLESPIDLMAKWKKSTFGLDAIYFFEIFENGILKMVFVAEGIQVSLSFLRTKLKRWKLTSRVRYTFI